MGLGATRHRPTCVERVAGRFGGLAGHWRRRSAVDMPEAVRQSASMRLARISVELSTGLLKKEAMLRKNNDRESLWRG